MYKELFLFSLIIILSIILIRNNKKNNIKIPDVKWPFLNLKNEKNENVNILVIRGFLDTPELKKQFLDYYNQGIPFIGCSSYLSYPKNCLNRHGSCHKSDIRINDKYIEEYVLGWCHCFKNADNYIKFGIPRTLISESDFPNYDYLKPDNTPIKYDFVCIQPIDNKQCVAKWHAHNKNWKLAETCIKIFVDEFNMKGIIIGRENCPVDINNKKNITTTGSLKYDKCVKKMKESKFMLLSNYEDASPRVLTEALSLNKPVFVYSNILGGWKYVNNKTGVFFNETNIRDKLTYMLNNYNNFEPRKTFIESYHIEKHGRKLKSFLESLYPNLTSSEYVKFAVS